MIIGFKGEHSKLSTLYSELGLKKVQVSNFDELRDKLKDNDGSYVICGFSDVFVIENITADLLEKRNACMKTATSSKKNLFLELSKKDNSLDRIPLDICIATKMTVKQDDTALQSEIFEFLNTDLPYSGQLDDGKYAVKLSSELRATARTASEIKKLI